MLEHSNQMISTLGWMAVMGLLVLGLRCLGIQVDWSKWRTYVGLAALAIAIALPYYFPK